MNFRAILTGSMQSVLFFFSGFFIPLIGLILTPVPLAVVYLRNSRNEGMIAMALSLAVIGVLAGWSAAFLFFICCGLMAASVAEGMSRNWRPENTALMGGLVPVSLLALFAARFFIGTGQHPVPFLEKVLQDQRAASIQIYTDLSLPEVVKAVQAVPDAFIHYFVMLIPGIILTVMVFAAALCSLLAFRMIQRRPGGSRPLSHVPLVQWHAPDVWVWGLIAGLILVMVPGETAYFAGLNLLIIYTAIYLIQGVAIVDHYLRKARVQPLIRGLLHTIILALPSMVFVIALGVVDIWADFRKVRGPQAAAK